MDFYLAFANLGLDVIVPMEGGASKAGSLKVLHDKSSKSHLDISPGESYIYFSQ